MTNARRVVEEVQRLEDVSHPMPGVCLREAVFVHVQNLKQFGSAVGHDLVYMQLVDPYINWRYDVRFDQPIHRALCPGLERFVGWGVPTRHVLPGGNSLDRVVGNFTPQLGQPFQCILLHRHLDIGQFPLGRAGAAAAGPSSEGNGISDPSELALPQRTSEPVCAFSRPYVSRRRRSGQFGGISMIALGGRQGGKDVISVANLDGWEGLLKNDNVVPQLGLAGGRVVYFDLVDAATR
mmetsp:Transcript_33556/g.67738  ORF Transcript_33556/g.67738 Transcript_33556/m.67738 type:complete len:237 (-) Transcript_33556:223-933(-)